MKLKINPQIVKVFDEKTLYLRKQFNNLLK
jgi:hypothetical protein